MASNVKKTPGFKQAARFPPADEAAQFEAVPPRPLLPVPPLRRRGAEVLVPEQGGTEDTDDAQVEEERGGQRPHGAQEGGQGATGHQPRPPVDHVRHDALHLEVCPHHRAHVEELVAVAEVIEAPRGQPLRQVRGE